MERKQNVAFGQVDLTREIIWYLISRRISMTEFREQKYGAECITSVKVQAELCPTKVVIEECEVETRWNLRSPELRAVLGTEIFTIPWVLGFMLYSWSYIHTRMVGTEFVGRHDLESSWENLSHHGLSDPCDLMRLLLAPSTFSYTWFSF
jgi:hypothetical protein